MLRRTLVVGGGAIALLLSLWLLATYDSPRPVVVDPASKSPPTLPDLDPPEITAAREPVAPETGAPVAEPAPAPIPAAVNAEEDAWRVCGAIRGTLFDDQSQRLPLYVLIFRKDKIRITPTTDRNGDFTIKRIPAGTWEVGVQGHTKGAGLSWTEIGTIEVWKDVTMPVELFLRGPRMLSGNLTFQVEGSGLQLELIDVSTERVVARGDAAPLKPPQPDEPPSPKPGWLLPGYFQFAGLPPGKYRLEASAGTFTGVPSFLRIHPFTVEVDLTAGDVILPPRVVTFEDLGFGGGKMRPAK